jgi:hypothetical protein
MNTMPQALDERPVFGEPLAPAASVAAASVAPRRADHLRLVVAQALPLQAASAATPYGLNGRRHLASVPDVSLGALPAESAKSPVQSEGWSWRRAEPMAFALVLMLGVSLLAAAVRLG